MRLSAIAAAAILSSCTLPQVVPEALVAEYKPTGEVRIYDRTASWDAVRVRSPRINVSKRTDGSWGGVLADRPIDVTVTANRISGVELVLTREASEGDKLVITGQFQGRIYRFEFDPQQVLVRSPSVSFTLPGRQAGEREVTYGPQRNLLLIGEAGLEEPPWPQLGFALLAMMQ